MKKRNRKFGKRALAVFVSLTMCLGMLQITAFAVEEDNNVKSWDVTMPDGGTVKVTGSKTDESWSGKSEDEKVTVDGSFEVREETSSSVPGEKQEGEIEVNIGSSDDQDRPLTETGSKVDTQETTITDTKVTEEKEIITETTTTQTEWKDGDVTEVIPGEKTEEKEDPKKDGYVPDLGKDLNTSGSITWNDGASKLHGEGGVQGNVSAENQKLKPDIPEGAVTGENDKGEQTWVKEDGATKITITEKLNDNGEVIGYETVIETITTEKGTAVKPDGEVRMT